MTTDTSEDPLDKGMRVRRSVLGDEYVDASLDRLNTFGASFYDYVTRSVWNEVWGRDGLDRRTRSCITIAILTALGREDEIELHTEVALRNGLTPSEVAEVILHCAAYAGVPMARGAMQAAERTLDRLDVTDERDDAR